MEGQEDMRKATLRKESSSRAVSTIILFHLIGLIGLGLPFTRTLFITLVPSHLLLMMAVIIFNYQKMGSRFLTFVLCLFILGYAAEWFGVNKQLLFGHYQYGATLGPKLSGVPLIIGLNWFLLTYSAGVLMQRSRLKSMFLRVMAGALLLTLLD